MKFSSQVLKQFLLGISLKKFKHSYNCGFCKLNCSFKLHQVFSNVSPLSYSTPSFLNNANNEARFFPNKMCPTRPLNPRSRSSFLCCLPNCLPNTYLKIALGTFELIMSYLLLILYIAVMGFASSSGVLQIYKSRNT